MHSSDQPFSPDRPIDDETKAALARLSAEWQRLEAWGETLSAETETWKEELLADADAKGLGEAIRRRS